MEQNSQLENVPTIAESGDVRHDAAGFRTFPNGSAAFGTVPQASAPFGTVRNDAESFRSLPHRSERGENHTLTVREVARLFEAAGVARTERSIVNWCQPNRTGIARLDSYFDPNERKYFISPQSVELAIAEEKAKAAKVNELAEPVGQVPQGSESFRSHPHDSETGNKTNSVPEMDNSNVKELVRENQNLRIANQVKDLFIEQLKKEQTRFMDQLLVATHKVGVLETKLLQIESPARSETDGKQNSIIR